MHEEAMKAKQAADLQNACGQAMGSVVEPSRLEILRTKIYQSERLTAKAREGAAFLEMNPRFEEFLRLYLNGSFGV